MENTVCAAYSGLVPMSPKTTPRAPSARPRVPAPCAAGCEPRSGLSVVVLATAMSATQFPLDRLRCAPRADVPCAPQLNRRANNASQPTLRFGEGRPAGCTRCRPRRESRRGSLWRTTAPGPRSGARPASGTAGTTRPGRDWRRSSVAPPPPLLPGSDGLGEALGLSPPPGNGSGSGGASAGQPATAGLVCRCAGDARPRLSGRRAFRDDDRVAADGVGHARRKPRRQREPNR